MNWTRRQFLARTTAGLAGAMALADWARADGAKIRLSACDWSLGRDAEKPEGFAIAKKIGLDGLEVNVGGGDTLPIANADLRKAYKESAAKYGLVVSSLAMGLFNNFPLATDPRGSSWLDQTITAARDLGGKAILVGFFEKGDLRRDTELKRADIDTVIQKVKDAAPKAKEAGVYLGLENTLSAVQNIEILEKIGNDAVRVYYDIGNSTEYGYDVPAEIKLLGDRICQIHFKDGGNYLGEGKVKMPPVAEAINAINYNGWICLETSSPSKDRDVDFKRNADFVRTLFGI